MLALCQANAYQWLLNYQPILLARLVWLHQVKKVLLSGVNSVEEVGVYGLQSWCLIQLGY